MAFQPLFPLKKTTTTSSNGSSVSGGFKPLYTTPYQPTKQTQIASKPKLDVGKAFASGGLQINSLGANLPPNAQKVVQQELQKKKKLDDFYNKIQNAPEYHYAEDEKLYKPFGFAKPVVQFAAGIVQGMQNTPVEAFKGAASLGKNRALGTNSWQQEAADIAAMVQLPLLVLSFGTSSVAKEGVKQTVKNVVEGGVKETLKSVAKHSVEGGIYGALGGIQGGKNITDMKEYALNLLANIGIGAGIGGGFASVSHLVLPLGKDIISKAGAVFIKDADKKTPIVTRIQLDPTVAQNSVVAHPEMAKSEVGKEIIRASIKAEQTEQHVVIIPEESGKPRITVAPAYDPEMVNKEVIDTFEKNVNEYRYNGGYSDGTRVEDAALRDIAKEIDSPVIKEHTQEKVKQAIEDGTLKPNEDGTITLYRGGEPSSNNKLMSASYDKSVAKRFADNAKTEVTEIKVKPDEIKAFIGKDEGEVLLANPKAKRTFNAKGEETTNKTKVSYNSKDSQAVQKVFSEKLSNIVGETKTQEEAISKVQSMLDEVTTRMKNDRRGLAGIRTAIQNEIKGLAGIGEGKVNYEGIVKAMYDDPDIGKYIEFLETKKVELDNRILKTPEAPEPYLPKEKRQVAPKPQKIEPSGKANANEPVGTGKVKDSRAYKRLVDRLKEEDPQAYDNLSQTEVKYRQANFEKQAEGAMKLIEEDPNRAYRIAKGYEEPPEGQLWRPISLGLSDRALAEKNYSLVADLESSGSLAQTRRGQEIAYDRGRGNDSSPHAYIQRVLDERLKQIGKRNITENIEKLKGVVGKKVETVKERAIAKIDQETEKAIAFTRKQRKTIDFAQKFLDEITCK